MKWVFVAAPFLMTACSGSEGASDTASPDAATSSADAASRADARNGSTSGPPGSADASSDAADGADAGPPLDVPASLVAALGGKTYVEGDCAPVTYPGWPYDAKRCTYRNGLAVTIANPEPERVARWIVESSALISALDGLHTRDRANWEAGLVVIAQHTIGQSSRIFPLAGQIYEDGTAYVFERGVTKTCSSGCYCRINSTSRGQWCTYASAVLKTESEDTCLDKYGQSSATLTEAWLAHCEANHEAAWNADRNEHYRAQAWAANNALASQFPDPMTANGAAVVTALEQQY